LIKFNFRQICLNSFKRVWPNSLFRMISLFIRPVYRRIRVVYRQNRPVGDFAVQILNQMDFGRFSPNFTEFGQFFQKPTGSEGADFLVSAGFLNTALDSICRGLLPRAATLRPWVASPDPFPGEQRCRAEALPFPSRRFPWPPPPHLPFLLAVAVHRGTSLPPRRWTLILGWNISSNGP
jgi:hypothetical protein